MNNKNYIINIAVPVVVIVGLLIILVGSLERGQHGNYGAAAPAYTGYYHSYGMLYYDSNNYLYTRTPSNQYFRYEVNNRPYVMPSRPSSAITSVSLPRMGSWGSVVSPPATPVATDQKVPLNLSKDGKSEPLTDKEMEGKGITADPPKEGDAPASESVDASKTDGEKSSETPPEQTETAAPPTESGGQGDSILESPSAPSESNSSSDSGASSSE